MNLSEELRDQIILFLESHYFIEVVDLNKTRAKESAMEILNFIKDLGGEYELEEMETNGWEHDIFIPFEYKTKKYTLNFGAMYNNMLIYREGAE